MANIRLAPDGTVRAGQVVGGGGEIEFKDNPAQKQALCDLIDAVAAAGGTIRDDWTSKTMTAGEAKRYVMSGGNAEDERGLRIGMNF